MKLFETIDSHTNKQINLYVDMDGVIAEYDIGNFDYNTIRPLNSNIKKLEKLSNQQNVKIYILSICKTDTIIDDKITWLKKYLPFLNEENYILLSKELVDYNGISSKVIKSDYLKRNIKKQAVNIVIDDDNTIIKYIIKNNPEVIVFQVSSLID